MNQKEFEKEYSEYLKKQEEDFINKGGLEEMFKDLKKEIKEKGLEEEYGLYV